jgi:hypothetical protein
VQTCGCGSPRKAEPVQWKVIAKDGAGLPPAQLRSSTADMGITVGETYGGNPFYREWLCGAGQGCRGRILERLYIDNGLPLAVELFRQLAFFILSCKPISYCRFKRIDVYIL